ncbi:hypothetical protein ACJIZ3_006412 [Penstemon smallii]|uniref:Uncharacterized protein n=1 Tax=Penstemon smallii TaxID=265156 RepID=A0ABD3S7Y7_9LAMI
MSSNNFRRKVVVGFGLNLNHLVRNNLVIVAIMPSVLRKKKDKGGNASLRKFASYVGK